MHKTTWYRHLKIIRGSLYFGDSFFLSSVVISGVPFRIVKKSIKRDGLNRKAANHPDFLCIQSSFLGSSIPVYLHNKLSKRQRFLFVLFVCQDISNLLTPCIATSWNFINMTLYLRDRLYYILKGQVQRERLEKIKRCHLVFLWAPPSECHTPSWSPIYTIYKGLYTMASAPPSDSAH